MIQFKSLVQYTRLVDGIRFPQNPDEPFLIIFYSENSSFLEDYPNLKMRRMDFRHVVVPLTKIPRTRMTSAFRKAYQQYKLLPFSSNMRFPKNKNLIYDLSNYLNSIDLIYKPTTYRQRAGFLINNVVLKAFAAFPDNYQKILLYSVNTTKPLRSFLNRKSFPLVKHIKEGDLHFDHLILNTVNETGSRYRLLVKDREFQFARVLQYMKTIKTVSTEDEKEEELEKATTTVYNKISDKISGNKSIIKDAIKNFLKSDESSLERITTDKADKEELERVAVGSVLFKVNGDLDKSKRLSKAIPKKKVSGAVGGVSKQYADELLQPQKTIETSDSILINQANIPSAVDNKSPEHIFNKRRVDFEKNLKKDMGNAFKVLEKRDLPLNLESVKIVDAPQKAGELNQSDTAFVTVTLKDKFGKTHTVRIEVPKIDPVTGTFRVNGEKKCLINQIILNPISFPKQYDSKFESSYSMFHITVKKTKRLSYVELYMGSFRLPFLVVLAYSFGFDNSLKMYGIKYKIVDKRPGKEEIFSKIPASYIVFENLDTQLKKEIAQSFIQAKIIDHDIDQSFGTKDYFNDLIISMTGRVGSTFLITSNLENIVDPIVRQILVNQQLPSDLPLIMKYMATKASAGFVQERNDITNQRIRNSEILVHLAQKQLLAAYTEYKEQYLAGNKDAKLQMAERKVLSQFVNLEIVQHMEYANPIEEMATITKVSPVGKSVGGIPDKRAIMLDARNVHPSYFGNIDPLDTAEGGNIGVTQQLTIDAYITSARGMFSQKDMSDKEGSGMLSTTTAMIPFIENNDGPRIMMAANQAKQMLPLKNPEPPIVQSGYESILTNVLSDSFIKRSPCNGKVSSMTGDYIEIVCKNNKKQRIDITPQHLHSGSGVNTLSVFRPTIAKGQTVKERQVIAEGGSISKGTISLGRTLAACYMPYKGYNFEDGIVVSETLIDAGKMTSLHGIVEEVTLEEDDRLISISQIGQKTKKGEPLFVKALADIEELLGGLQEEEDESEDIYDGKYIKKSPGGTIVDIEVYSNLPPSSFPKLKELIDRTNKKHKKPAKEKFKTRGVTVKGILIKFKIEQELQTGLGDKLCNRYGGKGIISLVEREEYMPRTPWGERVEIIFNPLGVLNRTNIGQMYELYCGLISKGLANRIVKTKSKTEIVKLLKAVMMNLDNSKDQKFSRTLISNVSKLSDNQFKTMVNQIASTGSVPIIIPPFKAPTNKNIKEALKVLGLKSGYKLKLPEFNTSTRNEVPFGYVYMSKLEHIGANKIHSRSTGPAVGKTMQPTAGKRREGGQRMGEGDSWALLSYNAPIALSEFFGPLSDDVISKKELEADIIQTGEAEFRETKASPTKDLLNSYFVSLMLGQ